MESLKTEIQEPIEEAVVVESGIDMSADQNLTKDEFKEKAKELYNKIEINI